MRLFESKAMWSRYKQYISLFAAVLLLFMFVLLAGVLVPIYADEVSTKITQASVFLHDGRLLTAIPQCFPELLVDLPMTWYPAAWIYQSLYHGLSPFLIRISGVGFAFAFIFLIGLGLHVLTPSVKLRLILLVSFLSVMGLGVLPLTLQLSRSEQWLLLILTCFIFFPFVRGMSKSGMLTAAFAVLFILCTSLMFFSHAKAAIFLPVVLVSGWIGFSNRPIAKYLVLSFTLACCAESILLARELYRCENAPIMANYFASQTVKLSALFESPLSVFGELSRNLLSFPKKITAHIIFQNDYQSFWLPSIYGSAGINPLEVVANYMIKVAILILVVSGLICPLVIIIRAKYRGSLADWHLIVGGLWLSIVAHLAIYKNWNFYGGVLIIGIMLVMLGFCIIHVSWTAQQRKIGFWFSVALVGVFFISSLAFSSSLLPRLWQVSVANKGIGIQGQPLSVPTFRFSEQRESIRRFANTCGLKGDHARRLVIDDLTYFAFDNLREPMHLVYISEIGAGRDIKADRLVEFLREMQSPGIVAQCTYLPQEARRLAVEADNLCCLNISL